MPFLKKQRTARQKMTLAGLKPGERGIVTGIALSGIGKQRLVDMGITPGIMIAVQKIAPLGDPIKLSLRGYELSIRKSAAAGILVAKQEKGRRM